MMRRRSIDVAAASVILVAPVVALAQGPTGSVTTTPVHQAPALGMWVLVALAVAMAGAAMYRLRRTGAGAMVGAILFATLTALAGLGYATGFIVITVDGADCVQQATQTFNPIDAYKLMSDCPNPIQIVDIEVSCGGDNSPNSSPNIDGIPDCTVGEILWKGAACRLPECV